jgi:hypothetical protein
MVATVNRRKKMSATQTDWARQVVGDKHTLISTASAIATGHFDFTNFIFHSGFQYRMRDSSPHVRAENT